MRTYRISKIQQELEMTGWNGFDGKYDTFYKITLVDVNNPFITNTKNIPSSQFSESEYYVGREIQMENK